MGLIFASKKGVFSIELDLLDAENYSYIYEVSSENVTASIDIEDGTPELDCQIAYSEKSSTCALTILLSRRGEFAYLQDGKDLSKFDTLDLDVRYSAPAGSPSIRVSFRNYNPEYVITGDYASLKYTTFAFEPYYNNSFIGVPLNTFNVERWWAEKYHVPKTLSRSEFTNISMIEIFPSDVKHSNHYQIWLNKLVLKGQLIHETTLYGSILLVWACLTCVLIYRNTHHLKTIAEGDSLTALLNRRGLFRWATHQQNSLIKKQSLSLLFIDIDDFRKINDIYGHSIGDKVLIALSKEINTVAAPFIRSRKEIKICRLTADQFVLVSFDITSQQTEDLAKSLMMAVQAPLKIGERLVKFTLSLGILYSEKLNDHFQNLLDKASMASEIAKKNGKAQYRFFDQAIQRDIDAKKQISKILKKLIDNDQFYLTFMPICSANTYRVKKAEVLLRTNSSELQGIGPEKYIPIAEEYNLIHEIDMWVITKTLELIKKNEVLLTNSRLVLCVNISSLELHHNRFVEKIKALLLALKVNPQLIELEITETSLVDVDTKSIQTLNELKQLGVGLALDDFGTGYAAFSQLHNYPVNCLKIDKFFIQNLNFRNEVQIKMIKTVLNIAEIYRLETIAEGVETEDQLLFLQKNSCQLVQGYLLSKPIPWSDLVEILIKHKPLYKKLEE